MECPRLGPDFLELLVLYQARDHCKTVAVHDLGDETQPWLGGP
jgi:hypothetical protein